MKQEENDLSGTRLTEGDGVSVSVPASTAPHAAPEHTPGPWVAEFTCEHAETRDGFWEIAPVGADGEPDWTREIAATADTNEANAHLIAAAPEMLESCKEMREALAALMRSLDQPDRALELWDAELDRLGIKEGVGLRSQAAIAKAEGREP